MCRLRGTRAQQVPVSGLTCVRRGEFHLYMPCSLRALTCSAAICSRGRPIPSLSFPSAGIRGDAVSAIEHCGAVCAPEHAWRSVAGCGSRDLAQTDGRYRMLL